LKSRQYNTGRFPAPAICTRAERHALGFDDGEAALDALGVKINGLFAEHRLASLRSGGDELDMRVGWRTDKDRIDRL